MFTKDEVSANAMGGTELQKAGLEWRLNPDLLDKFQITASRIRDLDPDLKQVLWCHDLAEDPEVDNLSDSEFRKQFDKIVFVSNWQQQRYNLLRGVSYDESTVIRNSIEPFQNINSELRLQEAQEGQIRLIYHTTPHRGLNILLTVFQELCKHHDNLHLDVYSSFGLYGDNWKHRDDDYKRVFEGLDAHPNITNHGAVSNAVVREALLKAHIFAYPSIWQETSCLSLIEAMSAGLFCVHPNYAALPETASNVTVQYDWNENQSLHAGMFYNALELAITSLRAPNSLDKLIHYLNVQKAVCDGAFSWQANIPKWEATLQLILEEEDFVTDNSTKE